MPRKQHLHHFIYKTTCRINEKFYVGMHSTSDLEDGYIGSGKYLWNSIKKYGKENFVFEILEWYPDRKALKKREEELVNEELLQNPLCINLKKGGEGGLAGLEQSTKEKIWKAGGKSSKGNLRLKEYFSASMESRLRNCGSKNGKKGKKLTEAHKKSISESRKITQKGEKNSQFGTCFINKEGFNKRIKIAEIENYLSCGWVKGRKGNGYTKQTI